MTTLYVMEYRNLVVVRLFFRLSVLLFGFLHLFQAFCPAGLAHAETGPLLERADRLYSSEQHGAAMTLLQKGLQPAADTEEESHIYWRLARSRFNKTDLSLFKGLDETKAKEQLEQGIAYAEKAISRYEETPKRNTKGLSRALFWKAANMGKLGQLKGVLSSLFMANDIRMLLERAVRLDQDFPNSYYVLGQLYRELPARPISFGDTDKAVNVGRFSIRLHEKELEKDEIPYVYHDFYLELAKHLWKRNWNNPERLAEQERKAALFGQTDSALTKAHNFAGSISIPEASDREEARKILQRTIQQLQNSPKPQVRIEKDLAKSERLENDWGLK